MSELPIPSKSHSSIEPRHSARGAVVLLPPRGTWEAIDALREKHDPQIVRWPPNIPLLFPFKRPEQFEALLEPLREVCQRFSPVDITLTGVRPVELDSGKGALWLTPEPAEPLVALQAAFAELHPELDAPGPRELGGYVPHLSVGKTRTHTQAQRIAMELDEAWDPVACRLENVTLVGRDYTSPMRVAHEIPLG